MHKKKNIALKYKHTFIVYYGCICLLFIVNMYFIENMTKFSVNISNFLFLIQWQHYFI